MIGATLGGGTGEANKQPSSSSAAPGGREKNDSSRRNLLFWVHGSGFVFYFQEGCRMGWDGVRRICGEGSLEEAKTE